MPIDDDSWRTAKRANQLQYWRMTTAANIENGLQRFLGQEQFDLLMSNMSAEDDDLLGSDMFDDRLTMEMMALARWLHRFHRNR